MDRLNNLLRHIEHVQNDCFIIGKKMIEAGEEEFGIKLIANSKIHDNSKFYGIEWENLNDGAFPFKGTPKQEELFQIALQQHVTTNPHHPQYWGCIHEMPSIYIAEMCADWHSRSSEQGTDLLEWIKERATERFKFTLHHKVYAEIKKFTAMLLERRFS